MSRLIELIATQIVLKHKYDKIKLEYEMVAYDYLKPNPTTTEERYNEKLNAFANISMLLDGAITQLDIELKNNEINNRVR